MSGFEEGQPSNRDEPDSTKPPPDTKTPADTNNPAENPADLLPEVVEEELDGAKPATTPDDMSNAELEAETEGEGGAMGSIALMNGARLTVLSTVGTDALGEHSLLALCHYGGGVLAHEDYAQLPWGMTEAEVNAELEAMVLEMQGRNQAAHQRPNARYPGERNHSHGKPPRTLGASRCQRPSMQMRGHRTG